MKTYLTPKAPKTKKPKILTTRQRELFVKYYPVISKVVNSMRAKLPSHADIDELHSAGVSGLADAVSKLDPSRKKSFDGYVATRVRGAIIDELRDLDYMSRSARCDAKNLDKLRESLEQKLGRSPTDEELRKAMEPILPPVIARRKKSPYPKTHHPEYFAILVRWMRQILKDPSSPVLALIDSKGVGRLMDHPEQMTYPMYGQLMKAPQVLAWIIQLNDWLKRYDVVIAC